MATDTAPNPDVWIDTIIFFVLQTWFWANLGYASGLGDIYYFYGVHLVKSHHGLLFPHRIIVSLSKPCFWQHRWQLEVNWAHYRNHRNQSNFYVCNISNKNGWCYHSPSVTAQFTSVCLVKHVVCLSCPIIDRSEWFDTMWQTEILLRNSAFAIVGKEIALDYCQQSQQFFSCSENF